MKQMKTWTPTGTTKRFTLERYCHSTTGPTGGVPVLDAELDAERDVDAAGGLHDGEVLGGVDRHEAERSDPRVAHERAQLAEAEVPVRGRGHLHGRLQVGAVAEELEHARLRRAVPPAQVRRQRGGHLRAALHAPPRARRERQRLLGPPIGRGRRRVEKVEREVAEAPHRGGLVVSACAAAGGHVAEVFGGTRP